MRREDSSFLLVLPTEIAELEISFLLVCIIMAIASYIGATLVFDVELIGIRGKGKYANM